MVSVIASESRKFCETTAIHGLPHLVRPTSRPTRFVWSLGVAACTCLLVWQLSDVTQRYLSYPVTTLITPSPDHLKPTFPDITVCNLQPLIYEKYMKITYREYVGLLLFDSDVNYERLERTIDRIQNEILTNDSIDLDVYDIREPYSPTSYISNLPMTRSLVMDYENETQVLSCDYFNWHYNPRRKTASCIDNMKPRWNPNYYKCHTFSPGEDRMASGFSAIFFVERFRGIRHTSFDFNLRLSLSIGFRVMIHAPGTRPDMTLGMNISPGMETSIVLDQTLRTNLPAPYSNCTTKTRLTPDDNTAYTRDYCIHVCLQRHSLKKCGCILSNYHFTEQQLIDSNYTVCRNLSIATKHSPINWKAFDVHKCSLLAVLESHPACRAECPSPCVQYRYGTSISAARWPDVATHLTFYATYIDGQARYGHEFDGYKAARNATGNVSAQWKILQHLDEEGLIRNNFLQLNVLFDSRSYTNVEDIEAFPLDTLGAQVGGVLSLWLGVTVAALLEVFEFLITLCVSCLTSKHTASNVTPAGTLCPMLPH